MSATRETVLKMALQLDEVDRILLVSELVESVAEQLPGWSVNDPTFLEELDRRSNDGTTGIPWDQVKATIESSVAT